MPYQLLLKYNDRTAARWSCAMSAICAYLRRPDRARLTVRAWTVRFDRGLLTVRAFRRAVLAFNFLDELDICYLKVSNHLEYIVYRVRRLVNTLEIPMCNEFLTFYSHINAYFRLHGAGILCGVQWTTDGLRGRPRPSSQKVSHWVHLSTMVMVIHYLSLQM